MKDETSEAWKKRALEAEAEAKKANSRASSKNEEISRMYKVQQLLIVAGFVSQEKIREAESLLDAL